MRRLNARRFNDAEPLRQQPQPILSTASGESPGPLETSAEPGASSRARAISPKIIVAGACHLRFLTHLQKKFSNALGFLPTTALYWYLQNKRVGLAHENDEPAGYVLGRTHFKTQPLMRPITQAAVAMDAQRRHIGMALIERVCIHAQQSNQLAVQAVCAEDLDANSFWRALEFQTIAIIDPNNARGRRLVVWRKLLTDVEPDWFRLPPKTAGTRAGKKG